MRPRIASILALAFALLTMGANSCATTSGDKATTTTNPTSDLPAETTKAQAKPDARYDLNCDYLLDFGKNLDKENHHFVGGGTLTNTGNIGARIRVTFKWNLLGQSPIVVRKTYRLPRGAERDINVSVAATTQQIDAHQSAKAKCSSAATIIGTFGTAR